MKKLLPLLLFLLSTLCSAIPFSGPGVNTHGQLLPVSSLRAIGVRWVRADLPPAELTEKRVKEFLSHYRGMPVLWMLSQQTNNAPAVAKRLARWGVTDIEAGNEVDLPDFNVQRRPWTGTEYGRWFLSLRLAVPSAGVRLYGPVLSGWSATFIQDAIRAGMRTAALDVHGYNNIADLAGFVDRLRKDYGIEVIVSEVGSLDRAADPSIWYLTWRLTMKDRPWCWYDGPATDWRGLFSFTTGSRWTKPTSVYDTLLAAIRNDPILAIRK